VTFIEQLGAWPARIAWILLALVGQITLTDALSGRSTAVSAVVWVGIAIGWTGGLVALLVPRTTSLTAARTLVPGGLVAAVVSATAGSTTDWADLAAVTVAAIAVVAVLSPWFTEAWVDGSSYGTERRLPLQTPPLFAGLVAPLTWLAVAASVVAGPLLLAARQWVAGALALAVGALVCWRGVQSLHQLARRWVVMVPNGLVIHDPLTLPEPHLFLRTSIAAIGPAEAGTDALDLTAGASGLALEVSMSEPVELLVRSKGRETSTIERTQLILTPARPARFLAAARENRLAAEV